MSSLCDPIYVEVGGKRIEVNEDIVRILNNYVKMEYSLERLAQDLGLESWEQAYEFVKKVPAWIMWISPTIFSLERQRCGSGKKPESSEQEA
ncbi:hypothetical protein ATG_07320 [Desulfurococcaceae archaeon AG1]|nr:hypothetical protein ATG_07320 [Desulfurococcaceae archaeon AG1]